MTKIITPESLVSTVEHKPRTVSVTLFRPSGKYYTSESWRVPPGADRVDQMCESIDFRQINGGAVLVEADALPQFPNDENWGVPHMIFVPTNAEVQL
jgi:hypothetical protein